MSRYKFKVGDRVVIINDREFPHLIGEIAIVLEQSSAPFCKLISNNYPENYMRRDNKIVLGQEDIILEEIWNSPLYQALKE